MADSVTLEDMINMQHSQTELASSETMQVMESNMVETLETTQTTQVTQVTEITQITEVTEVTEVTEMTELTELADLSEKTNQLSTEMSVATTEVSSSTSSKSMSKSTHSSEVMKTMHSIQSVQSFESESLDMVDSSSLRVASELLDASFTSEHIQSVQSTVQENQESHVVDDSGHLEMKSTSFSTISQTTESLEKAEATDGSALSLVTTTATSSSTTEKKKKKSSKKAKKSASSASSKSSKTPSNLHHHDSDRTDNRSTKIHVRSVDAGQVQKKFNKVALEGDAASQLCKLCQRQVFQMERIKAEKAVWHKNCFACSVSDCGKRLTVDTYNSHEGLLYCKPHFKQLFQPKAVLDTDEPIFLKPELIIRESQPIQLPEDVVRASESTSVNFGIDELTNLDLKSRFSLFERAGKESERPESRGDGDANGKSVKRSNSLMSRLRRFDADLAEGSQSHLDLIDSSSEGEGDPYDMELVGNRSSFIRDDSVSFGPIKSIKSKWEDESSNGVPRTRKEELARQRKEELQMLRARQCQGRQLRLKEAYEQATHDSKDKDGHGIDINYDPDKVRNLKEVFERSNSNSSANCKDDVNLYREELHGHLDPEKIRQMKQVFERGVDETRSCQVSERQEELSTIARESAKDARNLFKQMEESGFQQDANSKHSHREFYGLENKETFKTTSAMLNLFRRLESQPDGDYSSRHYSDDEEEEDDDEEGSDEEDDSQASGSGHDSEQEDENHARHRGRRSSQQEELLQIAKERALARNLRDKFERWEFNDEDEKQMYEGTNLMTLAPEQTEEIQASLNTTRNLRAHFEKLQNEEPQLPTRPRFKVNRFV